jgi:integrase
VDSRDDIEPKTVANHLTMLISVMNYAASLSVPWITRVPPFKKPKTIALGKNYRYLRNEEEIGRFLRAARDEGEIVFMLFLTAVRTGTRAGELAGLEWGDVDFDLRLILVQRSFTGPTKSGETRPVRALDALLGDLRAWRLRHPGKLVFTNRDGNMLARSGRIFQEVLHRVLDRADFPMVARETGRARAATSRSMACGTRLRRTGLIRGGSIFKLQKILGQPSGSHTTESSLVC